MRLVLDTNVWLDWLVFADPGVRPIQAALQRKTIEIVIDEDCEREFQRVLAYPVFALDRAQQSERLLRLRGSTQHFSGAGSTALCAALPTCRDADDQKFLVLACKAGADWLLTRDKALLAVSRHKLQTAGFRIATPAAFDLALAAASAAPLPVPSG